MSVLRKHALSIYKWALAAAVNVAVVLPWYVILFVIFGGETGMDMMPGYWFPMLIFLAAVGWELGVNPEDDPNPRRRRTFALVVGVAAALGLAYLFVPAGLRPQLNMGDFVLSVGVTATFLWLQGTKNAYDGLEYSQLYSKMTWQTLICVVGVVVASGTGAASLPGVTAALIVAVTTLILGYLLLLMVTREEELREGQLEMGDAAANAPIRPWLGVSVLGILGLGALSSTFMTSPWFRHILATLLGWLGAAYDFGFAVASLILVRWHQIFAYILQPPAIQEPEEGQEMGLEEGPEDDPFAGFEGDGIDPDALLPYYSALVIIVTVIVIGIIIYRMTGQTKRRQSGGGEEERESLGVLDNLLADLKGLLTRKAREIKEAVAPLRLDPRDPRAIYLRMQRWGTEKGRPRGAVETEGTYKGALVQETAAPEDQVDKITRLYQQVRYAEEAATPEQVDEAMRAAQALEEQKKE